MSTQTKTAPAPVDRRSPRILVVDDERSMRELMAIVLRREGYDVLLAENGRSAIDLLQREPVDLLISDIKMPDISGVEVLRAAKAVDRGKAIRVASGVRVKARRLLLPARNNATEI